MPLGKHSKTEGGRFRKECGDSLAKNLAKDYSEFKKVPPNTRLDTLEKRFGVPDLAGVRKALKQQQK